MQCNAIGMNKHAKETKLITCKLCIILYLLSQFQGITSKMFVHHIKWHNDTLLKSQQCKDINTFTVVLYCITKQVNIRFLVFQV